MIYEKKKRLETIAEAKDELRRLHKAVDEERTTNGTVIYRVDGREYTLSEFIDLANSGRSVEVPAPVAAQPRIVRIQLGVIAQRSAANYWRCSRS